MDRQGCADNRCLAELGPGSLIEVSEVLGRGCVTSCLCLASGTSPPLPRILLLSESFPTIYQLPKAWLFSSTLPKPKYICCKATIDPGGGFPPKKLKNSSRANSMNRSLGCEGACRQQVLLAVQLVRGPAERAGGCAQPAACRRRVPGHRAAARGGGVDACSGPRDRALHHARLRRALSAARRLPQGLVRWQPGLLRAMCGRASRCAVLRAARRLLQGMSGRACPLFFYH